MVKVIDPTPDPALVKRISCKNCGARLEYMPCDVSSYTHRDYGGGCDTYHYIGCPQCGGKVYTK